MLGLGFWGESFAFNKIYDRLKEKVILGRQVLFTDRENEVVGEMRE